VGALLGAVGAALGVVGALPGVVGVAEGVCVTGIHCRYLGRVILTGSAQKQQQSSPCVHRIYSSIASSSWEDALL
jgi:hypothetical protein